MAKNVRVLSSEGKMIGVTYPKRASGLVKKGRARYLDGDESVIVLASPPVDDTSQEDEMNNNFNFDEYIDKMVAAAKTAGDAVVHVTEKVADKTEEGLDRMIAHLNTVMSEYLDKKGAEKDAEVEKAEDLMEANEELEDYIDELEDGFSELEDELDELQDELDELQDELDELEELEAHEDDEDCDCDLAESRRKELFEKICEISGRVKAKIDEYEAAQHGKEIYEKVKAKTSAYAEDIAKRVKATYDEHLREQTARRAEKEASVRIVHLNEGSEETEALISQVLAQLSNLSPADAMAHSTLSNLLDGLMAERREKAAQVKAELKARKVNKDDLDAQIEQLIEKLARPDLSGAAQGVYRERLNFLMNEQVVRDKKLHDEKQKELADKQILLDQAVKSIAETNDPQLVAFFAERANALANEDFVLNAEIGANLMRLLAVESDAQKKQVYMEILEHLG